jgi:Arc/MetJ-type ribon-helix-helix transcriptional regulator
MYRVTCWLPGRYISRISAYRELFTSSSELVRDALRDYIDKLYESGYLPSPFQVNQKSKLFQFPIPNMSKEILNTLVRNGYEMSEAAIIRNALVPYKTGKYEKISIKRLSKNNCSKYGIKIPVRTFNMLHEIASDTESSPADIVLDALEKYLSKFYSELNNTYTLKMFCFSLTYPLFEEVENAVEGGCFLNRADMIREALHNYLFEDKVLGELL